MTEFLPLCDVLFNVISLAGYFCDVVFDVVLGYALYERQKFAYFAAVIVIVSFSLIISQIVSIRWYLNKRKIRNATASTTGPPGSQDAETAANTPGNTSGSLEKKKKKINSLTNTTNGPGATIGGRAEDTDEPTGSGGSRMSEYSRYIVLALHFTQLGVLWRYAKLFVPVDLRHVKHEVRDLCMLRLVHAFCEAAPMLLLQLYVLVTLQSEAQLAAALKLKTLGHHHHLPASTALVQQTNLAEQQQKTFRDLNMVSATLSLFSVCWALASFSKNVRLQNVHRLVLTWLGVIFQFLWRLGTVISRVISLTVYASVYSHWVFLVIILHWFSMFLWLISPKNVFHGERISRLKKTTLGGLIAFVYIFAYINLQELTFYVVMFAENCLLVCLWMVGVWPNRPEGWYLVPVSVLCSFAAGLFFMVVYYRYFHVRRLGYEAGGRISEKCSGHCGTDGCRCLAGHEHGIDGVGMNGGGGCKVGGGISGGLGVGGMNGGAGQKYPHAIPGSSVGSRVNIQQKLQEKKQKQLAELKIIEEEIKQGKLGGPGGTGTLSSGDDGKTTLPRQPIPRAKKHIDLDPIEWRTSSPDMAEIVANKSFNDLNLLLAANLDDVNSLNKFNSNYDPIYNSFGLNGINISALVNLKGATGGAGGGLVDTGGQSSSVPVVGPVVGPGNRNMSPISSQISAAESNSLTRQVMPRSKILPNNIPRNPFAENYRGNFVNLYADAAASTPAGLINGAANGNGGGGSAGVRAPSISPRTTEIAQSNRAILYDAHGRLYTDANHPRQVSGTYSSTENAGAENLPFPYNVVPPPRSKLDSRGTPTTPVQSGSASGSANNTNSSNKSGRTATTATMAAIVASVGGAGGSAGGGIVGAGGAGAAGVINNLNNTKRQNMQRAKTPEILLAPHYLENSRIYFDWVAREAANFRLQESERDQPMESSGDENLDNSGCDDGHNGHHRIPSDIDSQVSLPRSYTLPREFKYYRRNKGRKVKNEHFIASTNSSDGDVDSGDDNESERLSNLSSSSQRRVKNATPCTNLSNGHHGSVLHQQQQQQQHLQQPLPRQRMNNLNKSVAQNPPSISASMALMYAGGSGGQSPSGTMLHANGPAIPPVNTCRQTLNATPQNLLQPPLPQHAAVALANGYNLAGGGDRSSPAMPALLSGSDGSPVGKPGAVHSFDLISGVEAVAAGLPSYHAGGGGAANGGGVARPTRFRMYGTKNGMVRHETKL
uniref:XK-related protein n=1 Tax=Anopheles maculatus TaxID=74869 RepID=A0A182SPA7_9DIPT